MFIRQIGSRPGSLTNAWLLPFLIGTCLVTFGILIVLMPQLLAFIIAAFFIFSGISLIGFSLRLRSTKSVYNSVVVETFDQD